MRRGLLFILLLNTYFSIAQFSNVSAILSTNLDMANQMYDDRFYEEAITYYSQVSAVGPLNTGSILKLADSYRRLGMYEQARSHYRAIEEVKGLEAPESVIYYAEVLLSTGHLDASLAWFEEYERRYPGNALVANRILGLTEYDSFLKDSSYNFVTPLSLNTEHREFAPRIYLSGIAFTSSREKDLIIHHDHKRLEESLLDIYVVTNNGDSTAFSDPQRIKLPQHFKSNDGPFSQVENRIVVSRSNGYSKSDELNSLGLYFYKLVNGRWEYEADFIYNKNSYSITHPSFSGNADTLFFTSDMPGGYGGTDIYFSALVQDHWTVPQNVGAPINTPGDENFPFIDDGSMYFSSNGQPGLGGLDIYKVIHGNDGVAVQNLGYPVNTGFDDFAIFIDGDWGYFSSNRPGGQGYDDIYKFKLLPKPPPKPKLTTLDVDVLDSLSGHALDSVELILMSEEDTLKFATDDAGRLVVSLTPAKYQVQLSRRAYKPLQTNLELKEDISQFEILFLAPNIELNIVAPDSIIFKFADYRLAPSAEDELDQIVQSLHDYPILKLTIEAHTDSRGKADYNLWLSEMRATTTANYLMEAGVDMARISMKGYGETRLLNNCRDGIPCSPNEHAVNRRIEFILGKE
jgi:outer membrane protein OmpA-like peptidoglycan-associated protein